jgi:hypothetical protein
MGVVSSTGITASAPGGIGAPVAIRIALPCPTAPVATPPAGTSPVTASRAGAASEASTTSSARIA